MNTLAKRLSDAMKVANISGNKLAKAASAAGKIVHQQSIQQLLSGRDSTSKHLPAIARALGVRLEWLSTGDGPRGGALPEALLIGKVGAGAEIVRFDHPDVLAGIEPPPGVGVCNAAEISGDSQYPLQEGWIIFYGPEHEGIPEECLGKLSVVQVVDGPTLLKTIKRGTKRGLYRLESWNAPPREDVKIAWAAKVLDIRPR